MNKLIAYLLLAASVSLLFVGCSNKNSTEACLHEVTMNLDNSNWDAVLTSSCAGPMQKGAAYFGKAGFDVRDVINNFSDTGSNSSESDLNVYLTALVSKASGTSLADMDAAVAAYNLIPATSESYKDAQFYISLVDSVKGLSLVKLVLPDSFTLVDGVLEVNTSCDMNGNGVPDDADATGCALMTSASQSCATGVSVTSTFSPITILSSSGTFTYSGSYRGLMITVSGSGLNYSTCNTPNRFNKLLFWSPDLSNWVAATTTSEICHDTLDRPWPCPIENATGAPIDLVQTIDETMISAINALDSSLTGTQSSDVKTAIQDVRGLACCGCTSTPCPVCPTDTHCDSESIANYITNNLTF